MNFYCMVKMKCDNIHCWKLLLDLEGTQHNSVWHILLRLYPCYSIGCPICYIQVLGEVRTKSPELKIFKERGGKLAAAIQQFQSPL